MDITEKIENYLSEVEIQHELNEDFRIGLENLKDELSITINEEEWVNEERIDEAAITVPIIISTILAAPEVIKTLAKGIGFLYKKIKKLFGGEDESKGAEKIIEMAEKWHKAYIAVIRKALQMGGIFKAAGIKDKDMQKKATEVVFYTIILGFAVHGGVLTVKSFYHALETAHLSHIKMATFKSILTHLKAKEVKDFITNLIK
mgnify:CR=1 FL=1